MSARTRLPIFAVVLAALSALAAAPSPTPDPATRTQMDVIFDALSTALNLSLYESPFDPDKNGAMITNALGILAANAESLAVHGAGPGDAFDHLRRSLARDATEAVLRYRQERYEGVRFMLEQLTSNCVACHSKLPTEPGFDLGREFVERARVEQLPPVQRARLLVATRQFEASLDVYEDILVSDEHPAAELIAGGVMADYLQVALRVLDERRRVERTLAAFRRRNDLSGYLSGQVKEWGQTIAAFDPAQARGAELATAHRLIRDARADTAFPGDNHGLARFVLASGLLYRHLRDTSPEGDELAEAFYLLGVCESHTTRSAWVSETEFYLESSVRAAPSSPYARLALDFLEGYVSQQYRGSQGVILPEDLQGRLDELHSLIENARGED